MADGDIRAVMSLPNDVLPNLVVTAPVAPGSGELQPGRPTSSSPGRPV